MSLTTGYCFPPPAASWNKGNGGKIHSKPGVYFIPKGLVVVSRKQVHLGTGQVHLWAGQDQPWTGATTGVLPSPLQQVE